MDSKYYAPEIEEFHVGFEYEQLNQASQIEDMDRKFHGQLCFGDSYIHVSKPSVWDMKTCDTYTKLPYIKTWAKTEFRVKRLDQEDIESLGFVKWPDDDIYDLGGFQLHVGGYIDPYKVEIYDDNSEYCFVGVIKNKSELRKVLKMIGYE